jgi:hypothetical protein
VDDCKLLEQRKLVIRERKRWVDACEEGGVDVFKDHQVRSEFESLFIGNLRQNPFRDAI